MQRRILLVELYVSKREDGSKSMSVAHEGQEKQEHARQGAMVKCDEAEGRLTTATSHLPRCTTPTDAGTANGGQ